MTASKLPAASPLKITPPLTATPATVVIPPAPPGPPPLGGGGPLGYKSLPDDVTSVYDIWEGILEASVLIMSHKILSVF